MNKKISIIIPARNEESIIKETIESLKSQEYSPFEIIVVVNNSSDKTYQIAKTFADTTLDFKEAIGVCRARNEGVKKSEGEILIFTDADSFLSKGAFLKIANKVRENTLGSVLGRADNNSFRGWLFFFYKNWTHRLKIYQGVVDGVFFCHRNIFNKAGGFNEYKKIGEFEDIIKKMKKAGGKYTLMTDCWATVSLRRYEEKGYLKTLLFWIRWKIVSLFKKDNKLTGQYFNPKK